MEKIPCVKDLAATIQNDCSFLKRKVIARTRYRLSDFVLPD
jgi:hypothetical protein